MKITVMGQGAWGQALAQVASKAGHDVILWSRASAQMQKSDAVIIAVPAQALRLVLSAVNAPIIISAAKGIERDTGLTMAEIVHAQLPAHAFYALSGPSFAADVLAGLPTAITMAGSDLSTTTKLAAALSLPTFRIYASDDPMGVCIGGSLKNVLAGTVEEVKNIFGIEKAVEREKVTEGCRTRADVEKKINE